MKKAISILVIMTVLLSLTISVSAEDFPAIIFGNAEYATVLPVIDGEMDDIWYATTGYRTVGNWESDRVATAVVRVLWTEDALYCLADVEDRTLGDTKNNFSNCVNFWISEKNTTDTTAVYGQEPGNWFFSINHHGNISTYNSNGVTAAIPDEYAVTIYESGYIVEFKMNIKSADLNYSKGYLLGMNVSCDDDVNDDGRRDVYNNLYNFGSYWSNPGQLPDIRLVKSDCKCEMLCEDELNTSCPVCVADTANCVGEKVEVTEPETEPDTDPSADSTTQETSVVAWIKNLIAMILAFFANLFG